MIEKELAQEREEERKIAEQEAFERAEQERLSQREDKETRHEIAERNTERLKAIRSRGEKVAEKAQNLEAKGAISGISDRIRQAYAEPTHEGRIAKVGEVLEDVKHQRDLKEYELRNQKETAEWVRKQEEETVKWVKQINEDIKLDVKKWMSEIDKTSEARAEERMQNHGVEQISDIARHSADQQKFSDYIRDEDDMHELKRDYGIGQRASDFDKDIKDGSLPNGYEARNNIMNMAGQGEDRMDNLKAMFKRDTPSAMLAQEIRPGITRDDYQAGIAGASQMGGGFTQSSKAKEAGKERYKHLQKRMADRLAEDARADKPEPPPQEPIKEPPKEVKPEEKDKEEGEDDEDEAT